MKKTIATALTAIIALTILGIACFAGCAKKSEPVKQYSSAYLNGENGVVITTVDLTDGYSCEFSTGSVYLYDKEGTLLAEIETVVARDGFPLTIALSEDGKKLITSYMKVERDEPVSSVTFYNFGEVGRNYTRNLVGQVQYKECMVPRIEFWDNDTVLVMGENVMELFSMEERPESIHKKEITAEVESIAFGEYFCTVTKNKDGQEVLEAYNKSGEVCMKKVITLPYVGLHTAGDEVVLYSYSGCEVYNIKNGLVYQGSFENGIRQMFVIGGNRYYLVENRLVRVIKLV